MPPATNRPMGPITNSASKMATTPSTARTLSVQPRFGVSPHLDLDFGAARQRGHLHGRAGGPMTPERFCVDRVHGRELADVGDEDGCLGDVVE